MTFLNTPSGYWNIPIPNVKTFIVPSYGGPIREDNIYMFTPILLLSRRASTEWVPGQRTDH